MMCLSSLPWKGLILSARRLQYTTEDTKKSLTTTLNSVHTNIHVILHVNTL